jgi:hypothetical protein
MQEDLVKLASLPVRRYFVLAESLRSREPMPSRVSVSAERNIDLALPLLQQPRGIGLRIPVAEVRAVSVPMSRESTMRVGTSERRYVQNRSLSFDLTPKSPPQGYCGLL